MLHNLHFVQNYDSICILIWLVGNDNFLSDSSHPQEQTPPKVFSSPTNIPKSSKNGLSRIVRPQTAYGSTKTVLPNKMSLNNVQRKNGDTGVLPSSEKV